MDIEQKIKETVIDNFFSDRLEFSYDQILEMCRDDKLDNNVFIVEVFGDWYLPFLADHIRDLAEDLIRIVVKG